VELAAVNLKASKEQLAEAVSTPMQGQYRSVLAMQLEELDLLDQHIAELSRLLGKALPSHQDAVLRLCEIPGVREDASWQMIAELGPAATAFETAKQMASWIGVCPGREESAGKSSRSRSPKGNRTMRRVLNQVACSTRRPLLPGHIIPSQSMAN
jgi:transposase